MTAGVIAQGLSLRSDSSGQRAAGLRRGGAGGTSFAATTRSRGMTTSACRVRTVQEPASHATRWPSASVKPSSIRYRTTTRMPGVADERKRTGGAAG